MKAIFMHGGDADGVGSKCTFVDTDAKVEETPVEPDAPRLTKLSDNLLLKDSKTVLVRDRKAETQRLNSMPRFEGDRDHLRVWTCTSNGMAIFATDLPYGDDLPPNHPYGIHASVSLPHRLPTWEELKDVKRAIYGPEGEAFQVFPRESAWYSLHKYCLHLWELNYKWPVEQP